MENTGGPGFPNSGMVGGPPSRGDPMDFPGSRTIMGSPIGGVGSDGGPTMRDIVDSPLGGNLNMNNGNEYESTGTAAVGSEAEGWSWNWRTTWGNVEP